MSNFLLLPQTSVAVAIANPLAGADHQVASWFHAHLTRSFVTFLKALSEPGSANWIGIVLFFLVLFFIWKRHWPSLLTLIVAVPGGMLLNEWIKLEVHRPRPFVTGPFVDWSGYSFASGHTVGATLLYGQLALFILPKMKSRHWRSLTIGTAIVLVALVGFSRIALGAHYLTDVLSAIVIGSLWLTFCLIAGKPMRRPVLPESLAGLALPSPAEFAPVVVAEQSASATQKIAA